MSTVAYRYRDWEIAIAVRCFWPNRNLCLSCFYVRGRGGGWEEGRGKDRERAKHESSSCHASSHTRRDVSLTSSSSPRFQSTSRSAPYWITLRKNEKNMPSIPWKPFGLNNILPRRFPRQRRGNKRQPIVPLKEWKIVRGDTVRKGVPCAKCISMF